jgi:hypothetical protein
MIKKAVLSIEATQLFPKVFHHHDELSISLPQCYHHELSQVTDILIVCGNGWQD